MLKKPSSNVLVSIAHITCALFAISLLSTPVQGSSHREAPSTAVDPQVDATDVYAFVDPINTDRVTLIANFIPFQLPQGGPNFYQFGDNVLYEIRIDNVGDGADHIAIQFKFRTTVANPNTFLYNTGQVLSLDSPNLNIKQFYDVTVVRNPGAPNQTSATIATNVPVAPANVGPRSTPNYEVNLGLPAVSSFNSAAGTNDIQVFAGSRDDPFFIDVGSAFDLLGLRPFNLAHLIPLATAAGVDGLFGLNVNTIAIQAPIRELTSDRQPLPASNPQNDPRAVIGVWSAASRPGNITFAPDRSGRITFSGTPVQLSRLGNPLVNELIIPLGMKDHFNFSLPSGDAQFASYVLDPEPARLIHQLYPTINVPPTPRSDVATIFLTGVPGLNVQTNQAGPGVNAFPGQPANTVPNERLRLNMGIPPTPGTASAAGTANRLGFLGGDNAGYPNGRRVGDDVPDIILRVAAGGTPLTPAFNISPNKDLGDGVNENDRPFLTRFPYVATPYAGYDSPTTGPNGVGTTDTNAPAAPKPEPTPRP